MRWFDLGCVAFVATAGPLLAGCFKELPPPIVGASTSDTGSTTDTSATADDSSTGDATLDVDITSGHSSTGPGPQGLFACETPPACPLLDCSQGCGGAEPELTCALQQLQARTGGPVDVRTCAKSVCSIRRVMVRADGTEQAQHQSRDEDDPLALSPLTTCTLKSPELFTQCLDVPEPTCADPDTWLKPGCVADTPHCPGIPN